MGWKKHKKHVKDLLAQAIVHTTLGLERYRQVEIKKKLDEIAKIERVRRVRTGDEQSLFDLDFRDGEAERERRQDEVLLPLLTPRSELKKKKSLKLPKATHKTLVDMERPEMKDNLTPSISTKAVVINVDDDGRQVSPPPSERQPFMKTEDIDSRHLYALDSEALQKYDLKLSKMENGRGEDTSPYVKSQFPTPPWSPRSQKSSPGRSGRMSQSPVYSEKKSGSVRVGRTRSQGQRPEPWNLC